MKQDLRWTLALAVVTLLPALVLAAPPSPPPAPLGFDGAVKQLQDTSALPKKRRAAAIELGQLKDPKAIPVLIQTLQPAAGNAEEIWFVRTAVVKALVAIGPASLLPVKEALKSNDLVVRYHAIMAITALAPPDVIEILEKQLKSDPEAQVRTHCVFGLRDLKMKKGIPILRAAARDDADEKVRKTAANALNKLESGRAGPLR